MKRALPILLVLVLVGIIAFSGMFVEVTEDFLQLFFFFLLVVFLVVLFFGRKLFE